MTKISCLNSVSLYLSHKMLRLVASSMVPLNGILFSDSIFVCHFIAFLSERVKLKREYELKTRMWSWGKSSIPPDVTHLF